MEVKPYILVFNKWNDIISKIKLFIGSNFEMKEMGESVILVITFL